MSEFPTQVHRQVVAAYNWRVDDVWNLELFEALDVLTAKLAYDANVALMQVMAFVDAPSLLALVAEQDGSGARTLEDEFGKTIADEIADAKAKTQKRIAEILRDREST